MGPITIMVIVVVPSRTRVRLAEEMGLEED